MTNDVLQEFSGQPADPVTFVPKQRARVTGPLEFIAIITLEMHWPATEKPVLQERAHSSSDMAELIVMSDCYL